MTLLSYRAPGSQWGQGLTVSRSGTTCMVRLWTPSMYISRVATGLGVQSGPGVTPRDSSGSKPPLTLEARGMSRYGQNKKCLLFGNPTDPTFFWGGGGGPTLYCLGHLRFFTFFLLLYFNNLQGFLSLEGITAKLTTYLTGLDKQKISA